METIYIENFAGIKKMDFDFKSINILIGPQGSGKSVTVKLMYFFKNFINEIVKNIENEESKRDLDKNQKQIIANNKKAYHDYFIEEKYEAGIVLSGWEVKAIRAGRVQLKDTYVIVRDGELWLLGGHISPLLSASTHVNPDPTRTRKLLLKADEISRLIGKVEQRGFTLVPLDLHYTRGKIKCEIALARGKAEYDKRHAEKDREWQREKQRVISQINHK